MAAGQLAFDILARDKASKTFDKVSNRAQSMGDRMDKVGTRMAKAAGVVALGGIVALGAGLVQGIRDAASYEVVAKKTAAVIASTGNVANISVGGVQALAGSLESLSGVDEELIINSQNVLATFTKVRNEVGAGNDIFDQGAEAALNMSVALGQDLQGATIMVGKALNDPIRGITALRRAGVQLTEAQEQQIRTMVESGDVMGAQKVILAELETQFGGAAAAAGDSFSGQVARAKDALSDMGREVGTAVLPVLGSLADWIASDGVGALREFAGFISGNVIPVAKEMKDTFEDLPQAVQVGVGALAGILATAPLAVSGFRRVKDAIEAVSTAYTAMGRAGRAATLSLGAIGLALAAGTAVLGFFAKAKLDAKERVEAFTGAIEADSGAMGQNTQEAIANSIAKEGLADLADDAGVSIETLAKAIAGDSDAMDELRGKQEAVNSELMRLTTNIGGATDAEREHVPALKDQQSALSELIPKVGEQRAAMSDARAEYELSREVQSAVTSELGANKTAHELAKGAIDDTTGALAAQNTELQTLIDSYLEASGLVLSQRDAQRQMEESIDQATEALDANGVTLDITTEKGRNNQDALDGIADSTFDLIDAMAENGSTTEQLQATMANARVEFVRTATQMGMSETAANQLADQLGLIPGDYKANVSAPGATKSHGQVNKANRELDRYSGRNVIAELQAIAHTAAANRDINSAARNRTATIFVRQTPIGNRFIQGLAHGGTVKHSGFHKVGEQGPELRFLNKGDYIATARETDRILRGVRGVSAMSAIAQRGTLAPADGRRLMSSAAPQSEPRSSAVVVQLVNHGVIGSRQELQNWLARGLDDLQRQGRLPAGLAP